jgi:hypothetical protein
MEIAYSTRPLKRDSLESMDRENRRWPLKSGTPPKSWAPVGGSLFVIQPRNSSGTVTLTTLDVPTVIADNSTAVDLPSEYIQALESYVFGIARFKESGVEFAQGVKDYRKFLDFAAVVAMRQTGRETTLWGREPASKTGQDYATQTRS